MAPVRAPDIRDQPLVIGSRRITKKAKPNRPNTIEGIPAAVKEKELEIARDKAREAGKPENLLDRIAEGSLQKFYKESTLLQQDYVKDAKKSVEQFLKESDKELTVSVFKRVSLNA